MTENLITGSHELAQAGSSAVLHICAASGVPRDLFTFALYILHLDSFNGLQTHLPASGPLLQNDPAQSSSLPFS